MNLLAVLISIFAVLAVYPVHGQLLPADPRVIGITVCTEPSATIVYDTRQSDSIGLLTHEMLHVADCADDRELNGSVAPYPCDYGDCAHQWVYWALQNQQAASEWLLSHGRILKVIE